MSKQPFALAPENYARPLEVVGEQITVLASRDVTSGYEIFQQAGPEGSGPPPHSHGWDESFYVIDGEIEFGFGGKTGDETATAKPGTLVHLPAGCVHWFRFGAGGGRMISMTGSGNASAMFTDFDANISSTDPDLGKLVEVGTRHGLTLGV
jgi:quercetin dioxygenase-like cupin family protein